VCSDGQNDEPHAKQAKLDDSADLAGGLPSMLKTKITEVCVIILASTSMHTSTLMQANIGCRLCLNIC